MAMLAEPRRRVKYSTDPRGLNWSQDDSKFGQRLMEKMGWEKGKGLGVDLRGQKHHIGVKYKDDQRGLGCSKNHADNWIAHQDDFNSLLSSLNQENATEGDAEQSEAVQVLNLEERSKTHKGRVHYKKFTRGKDLSRAKANDMDSIFGRRAQSAPCTPQGGNSVDNSAVNSEDEKEEKKEDESSAGKEETLHGFTTISTGVSVADYFARKMAELKRTRSGVSGGSAVADETVTSNQEDSCVAAVDDTGSDDGQTQKKKKKSKKNKVKYDEPEPATECNDDTAPSIKKKKKKDKKKKVDDDEDDELDTGDSGNKKECIEDAASPEICDAESPSDEDSVSKKSKKKKKKKSKSESPEDGNTSEHLESVDRKKKKKNRDELIESSDKEDHSGGKVSGELGKGDDSAGASSSELRKKKKKKRKGEKSDEEMDTNEAARAPKRKRDDDRVEEVENESSSKKKVEIDADSSVTDQSSKKEQKKKKKKTNNKGNNESEAPVKRMYKFGECGLPVDTECGFKGSNHGDIKGYAGGVSLKNTF